MKLCGRSIIGGEAAEGCGQTFRAFDPSLGQQLDPPFCEAGAAEVGRAFALAEGAFEELRRKSPEETALFLEAVADEIVALGDELIERASAETGLPAQRLTGERARTIAQLRMFADVVREGSWVEATIDRADPDRKPIPKPDLRRMLIPVGPVVVFGASNFPLAFSVAGGDTASALAAGNPVIVKAHHAHPGTSELVGVALSDAVRDCDLPEGVFSLLYGSGNNIGMALVKHPLIKAGGFTGSRAGGRALFDA